MLACLADLAGEQPSVIADRVLSTMSSEPCTGQCEDAACVAGMITCLAHAETLDAGPKTGADVWSVHAKSGQECSF